MATYSWDISSVAPFIQQTALCVCAWVKFAYINWMISGHVSKYVGIKHLPARSWSVTVNRLLPNQHLNLGPYEVRCGFMTLNWKLCILLDMCDDLLKFVEGYMSVNLELCSYWLLKMFIVPKNKYCQSLCRSTPDSHSCYCYQLIIYLQRSVSSARWPWQGPAAFQKVKYKFRKSDLCPGFQKFYYKTLSLYKTHPNCWLGVIFFG